MKNTKHTQGPWKAKGSFVHSGNDCIASTQDNNAALIAAAPDLLDALDLALEALSHCDLDKAEQSSGMIYKNVLAEIKAAAQKARGQ